MDTVRSWAMGLCMAAVAGAAVTALTPSGALEKSVKTVVSVFLLCSMILPLFNNYGSTENFSSNFFDGSDKAQKQLTGEVSRQAGEFLKSSIEKILEENGILYREVVIQMETTDESVSVESVTVAAPDADGEEVKNLIKNELGVEVQVEK